MTTALHHRITCMTTLLVLAPGLAYAHTGTVSANGWEHGVLHPFLGLDHLCAMIAVGLWARQLVGLAVWIVPISFVSVMALGGMLGMTAIPLPFIEGGILMSLLVLGVLIAAAIRLPLPASAAMVGLFALFHGYAHGAEMPHSASALSYALGFMSATAVLHATGIVIANWLHRSGRQQWLRLAGVAVAAFGGALYLAG